MSDQLDLFEWSGVTKAVRDDSWKKNRLFQVPKLDKSTRSRRDHKLRQSPKTQIIKLLPYLLARQTGIVNKMNRPESGIVLKMTKSS